MDPPEWANFTLKEKKKPALVTGEVRCVFIMQLTAFQHSAAGVLVEETAV